MDPKGSGQNVHRMEGETSGDHVRSWVGHEYEIWDDDVSDNLIPNEVSIKRLTKDNHQTQSHNFFHLNLTPAHNATHPIALENASKHHTHDAKKKREIGRFSEIHNLHPMRLVRSPFVCKISAEGFLLRRKRT